MSASRRAVWSTRQHAGDLVHPTRPRDLGRTRQRHFGALAINDVFLNNDMVIGNSCHLGQVGHNKYLMGLCEARQALSHGVGGRSANSGVNLVKHQDRWTLGSVKEIVFKFKQHNRLAEEEG